MALQEFLELSFARKSCGTASSQPFDLGLQFGDCLLHLTDALAYLIVRRSSRWRTCGLGGHRNQRLFFDALDVCGEIVPSMRVCFRCSKPDASGPTPVELSGVASAVTSGVLFKMTDMLID